MPSCIGMLLSGIQYSDSAFLYLSILPKPLKVHLCNLPRVFTRVLNLTMLAIDMTTDNSIPRQKYVAEMSLINN